jgi:hypothetical protein
LPAAAEEASIVATTAEETADQVKQEMTVRMESIHLAPRLVQLVVQVAMVVTHIMAAVAADFTELVLHQPEVVRVPILVQAAVLVVAMAAAAAITADAVVVQAAAAVIVAALVVIVMVQQAVAAVLTTLEPAKQ